MPTWIDPFLKTAASVSGPLSLIGLLIVAVLFSWYLSLEREKQKDDAELKKLRSVPEEERFKYLTDDLIVQLGLELEATRLTKQQTYELVIKTLEYKDRENARKSKAAFNRLIVIAIVVVLLAGMAIFGPRAEASTKRAPPPEFTIQTCITADDPNLEPVFGSSGDDIGMPRQNARTIDDGHTQQLGGTNVKNFWLLASPFGEDTSDFTLYVYVGTTEKVAIAAWLTYSDGSGRLEELNRKATSEKGLYLFTVKDASGDKRILVSLGMKEEYFNAISSPDKFHVRSQPM